MYKSYPIKTTFGPSLYSDKRVVIFEYDDETFGRGFDVSETEFNKGKNLLPEMVKDGFLYSANLNVHDFLVSLVNATFLLKEGTSLKTTVKQVGDNKFRLLAEYDNLLYARRSVEAAILLMEFVKSEIRRPPPSYIDRMIKLFKALFARTPSHVTQNLEEAAKKKKIPTNVFLDHTPFTLFGQGIHSKIFDFGLSEQDSHIGFAIQKNKSLTHNLLKKLGYPTPEQYQANSFERCIECAKQIGFPVVVKPSSEGQGSGVTANVRTMEQLKKAFQEAQEYSSNNVLVEKHIEGDVYRITLSQFEIIGLGIRYLARVTGDGHTTIKDLIKKENQRRAEMEDADFPLKDLKPDDRLKRNLENANYTLDSVPKDGEVVMLGDIANRSVGGTVDTLNVDVIHPDNVEMFKDLCKLFRLDSVGIDMITTDISKSWRDNGVIIEMNCYPGSVLSVPMAVMDSHFGNTQGRIPTTLVISDSDDIATQFFQKNKGTFEKYGFANKDFVMFESGKLNGDDGRTAVNCQSLIFNKSCDGLIASISPDEFANTGLPLDYFDYCIVDQHIDLDGLITEKSDQKNLQDWLKQYVSKVEIQ